MHDGTWCQTRCWLPSVLWHCWLGVRKTIWPVKIDWRGVSVVISLKRGADCIWPSWCHCIPKPPLSLVSFKSRLAFPFWYRLMEVVHEKRPLNGCSSSSSRGSSSGWWLAVWRHSWPVWECGWDIDRGSGGQQPVDEHGQYSSKNGHRRRQCQPL